MTESTLQPVGLSADRAQHLLRQMIRIRRFEEKCAELYSAQKIRGFLHLCIGEEAVNVGLMEALQPEDAVVATYREHGQAIARGLPMKSVMAEMYGKLQGCCRGRGGSMHIFDKETRFYGGNAIVGGGLPLAVGMALADKMQGRNRVSCCIFGDGAVAEGEFHESMNLAELWQLPVLFVCENNLYAMGTALKYTESEPDLVHKAEGYKVPGSAVDGMDVVAVEKAAREACEKIRSGIGPYFLECQTYRFRAHSMFDAQLYRDKEEVEEWKERGPIVTFTARLRAEGLIEDSVLRQIEEETAKEVQAAVDFAEQADWESVDELEKYVYSEKEAG